MTPFARFAPAGAVFAAGSAQMALGFGFEVLAGGSPITPETYGDIVFSVPALVWVGVQLAISAAALAGFVWQMPRLAAIASVMGMWLMAMFGIMAADAPQGSVLKWGAIGWCAFCWAACFLVSARVWGDGNGRE